VSHRYVQRCVFPLSTFLHIVVILYVVSFQMNKYLYFTVIPSIECVDPGSVANASYTSTGLTIGSVVTYACDPGYQYEAGFLTRTCLADGTWDGVPPVCSGMLLYIILIIVLFYEI
jgi:hypothetical protein